MSTYHYGINNSGISRCKPALQGGRVIRSILFWWRWRSTRWTEDTTTKGLLLMESISRLMDAGLGARWLHWLCVLKPKHAYVASLMELTVYSPSPAVRSKPELNCQSWRESTFNQEEAIRGSLFPVNANGREGQRWQATKHAGRVGGSNKLCGLFQWTVWLLASRRTHSAATGSTHSIFKSHLLLKVPLNMYSSAGLIKITPWSNTFISH